MLITHISYPYLESVNDFIDPELAKVQNSNFDHAVHMVRRLDYFRMCFLELAVPVADEKTVGPQIELILSKSKVSLRELQSLTGSLDFCTKTMPSARAFARRMYSAMSLATRPRHYVRVTKGIQKYIEVWSLPDCWPPSLPHLVQFVAHLSKFKKCAFSTINAYLSGISFFLKPNNLQDFTRAFIIQKMLCG
ncbi:hypothetical protein MAR_018422 [Mya arenaria]|uniref:Uncharacterized protein n=1 Tax=Mya arenaria TaxID=6604 RepID=A0ABY7EJ83_MYAAR|nr:hypothetical protein MAR_018422 [Mya arenaria]